MNQKQSTQHVHMTTQTRGSRFFKRVVVVGVLFGVINVTVLHQLHIFQHGSSDPTGSDGGGGGGGGDRHLLRGGGGGNSNSNNYVGNGTVPMSQINQAAFLPTHKEFKELSHAHTNEIRRRKQEKEMNNVTSGQSLTSNAAGASIPPIESQSNKTTTDSGNAVHEPLTKEEKRRKQKEAKIKKLFESHNISESEMNSYTKLLDATPPPDGKKTEQTQKEEPNSYSTDVIFNGFERTRYFCGIQILPHQTIPINDTRIQNCHPRDSITRIWPVNYTLRYNNLDGLDPIVFHWNGQEGGPVQSFKDCDVPCTYTGRYAGLLNRMTFKDLPIAFDEWSMEGEEFYPNLALKPHLHKLRHYLATTSFKSDIPLPYYSEAEYNIQTEYPPVQFDDPKVIKGASFIARNCGSKSNRENMVKEMIELTGSPPIEGIILDPPDEKPTNSTTNTTTNDTTPVPVVEEPLLRIESVSSCLHNVDFPRAQVIKKEEIMRSYLFHLSFENSITDDYITEKLWGSLRAGIVPVYHGAPNVREHVPPRSIILIDEFESIRDLVEYLTEVAHNKTLYESYHAWRFKELPESFHKKYDMTRTHSVCRACRFGYATRQGWGWDHEQQKIVDTRIPRETCVHRETGMISRPVTEVWDLTDGKEAIFSDVDVSEDIHKNDDFDCSINQRRVLTIDGTSWTRIVSDHDGVTDLEVRKQGILRPLPVNLVLNLPIKSTKIKSHDREHKVYWIQDEMSRVVLAFDTKVSVESRSDSDGQVIVHVRKPFRLRILVVDLDTNSFHEDGRQQESYFESVMLDDFFQPLQVGNTSLYDWFVANATITEQRS
mmetsp:Transcript_34604/g.83600  ORF Transcript_34604/g.83600 Transcript_34604/m.83600 type:complete len:825 (-) Transcript_34604:2139-4613(-)